MMDFKQYPWMWESTAEFTNEEKKKVYKEGVHTVTNIVNCSLESIYQNFEERRKRELEEVPKSECEHGHWVSKKSVSGSMFKWYIDKHCRDCGEKL